MPQDSGQYGIAPFDLVIRGAEVVSSLATSRADVAIRGEKIAALFDPNEPTVSARRTVDASGLLLMAGAIDAHVHFREPGLTHKEDFASGTRAAAAGGVTTVMVMPTDQPWTLTSRDFATKKALLEGRAFVDVALQAALDAELSNLAEIDALAEAGAVSFELFLGDVPSDFAIADNGRLAEAFERIEAAGSVAGVTPADNGIIGAALARTGDGGGPHLGGFFATRPPISEALGVARACVLAEATGASVHIRQLSAKSAIAILRDARRRVSGLSAEVTPHNLLLTYAEALTRSPIAKVAPPIRAEEDRLAVWEALSEGVIDIVATDHAPHAPQEKEAGREDIRLTPGGFPGVQTLVPLLIDAAANGRLGYGDVARLIAEKPAQIFGLYPRKGAIRPGADADLILVDPEAERTIRVEEQQSKARLTPFAGRTVRGAVKATFLRGKAVAEDGHLLGEPHGRFIAPVRS